MNQNTVEIFKRRDFGEFISTPITFFVQEFKLLAKCILFFVGPIILLESIMVNYFGLEEAQNTFSAFSEGSDGNPGTVLLLRIVQVFESVMLYSLLGVYVKLYFKKGKGNYNPSDIWKEITKFYWPIMGGQILAGILILIGTLLLILPGIYLGVVMSLLFVIIIFEEEGIGKSISRAFEVIKGYWWTAFGAFLVMGILFIIFLVIFGLVIGFLFGFAGYGPAVSTFLDAIGGFVIILITTVIGLLPIFLYASFIADKENPQLMGRIKDITGENEDLNSFQFKEETKEKNVEPAIITKDKAPKTEEDWGKMLDDQEKENRFENGDENEPYKPKF